MQQSGFVLVGPGRLGRRLAGRMADRGHVCRLVRGRTERSAARLATVLGAQSDTWLHPVPWPPVPLVMISVPDREIPAVAARLAATADLTGTVVLHTSGLLCADVLGSCRDRGAAIGSWHPLQSFPESSMVEVEWDGVPCAVEGDGPAVAAGERLARELSMKPWRIRPERKALYHAAAAVAANLTHILISAARNQLELCTTADLDAGVALRAVVRTSVEAALAAHGLKALTGPIARDDRATIARHLEALPPELAAAYRAIVRVAEAELNQESSH